MSEDRDIQGYLRFLRWGASGERKRPKRRRVTALDGNGGQRFLQDSRKLSEALSLEDGEKDDHPTETR